MARMRRSDGTPEPRSIDDIIRQALGDEELTELPGYGQPLDLSGYFASGPEHRAANRLLRDNKVLPQALQDRKEAEELLAQADQVLQTEEQRLARLRPQIDRGGAALSACFADEETLLQVLGLKRRPAYLPPPCALAPPTKAQLQAAGQLLGACTTAYNRRIQIATSSYLRLLEQANECIERLNRQVMVSRDLPDRLQLVGRNMTQAQDQLQTRLVPLEALPEDLENRLKAHAETVHPSLWHRLLHRP